MKRIGFLLSIVAILANQSSFADIVSPNTHYVSLCVEITNLSSYPDITLVAYQTDAISGTPIREIVTQGSCLSSGYKFNSNISYFRAVKKDYLVGKDVTTIDWTKETAGVGSETSVDTYYGFISDENHLSGIHQYYKILGFSTKGVVLFMWKEETTYNDGTTAQLKSYTYSGDISALSQNMTDLPADKGIVPLTLFPNPVQKDMTLQFSNNYHGKVEIKMISIDGKLAKNIVTEKTASSFERHLSVEQLPKGYYLVTVTMGDAVETRRILVE